MKFAAAILLVAVTFCVTGCVFDEARSVDYKPAPHGSGGNGDYAESWFNAQGKTACNSWNGFTYYFFNTNNAYAPYDRWYPEQLQNEWTTIHKTIDLHFFNYDWDDPYIN